MLLAQERLADGNARNARSEAQVMDALGVTEDDIAEAEDVDIE